MEVDQQPSLFAGEETSKALTPKRHCPSTIELAPIHDVVFVLSNGDHLCIHTMALRLASPVFAVMFGPNFAEGQRLSETNPQLVPLPDDDPAAMTLLCRVLHHQDRISEVPKLKAYLRFAELADKYDCISAVRATAALWTLSHISKALNDEPPPSNDLLAITYLLDQSTYFRIVTREIISRQDDQSVPLLSHTHRAIPPSLFLAMAQLRTNKKRELREGAMLTTKYAVNAPEQDAPGGGYSRNCKNLLRPASCQMRIKETFFVLEKALPVDEYESIAKHVACCNMRSGMTMDFDRTWSSHSPVKPCELCCEAFRADMGRLMAEEADNAVAYLDGLCLVCLKRDGEGFEATYCQVHTDDLLMVKELGGAFI